MLILFKNQNCLFLVNKFIFKFKFNLKNLKKVIYISIYFLKFILVYIYKKILAKPNLLSYIKRNLIVSLKKIYLKLCTVPSNTKSRSP